MKVKKLESIAQENINDRKKVKIVEVIEDFKERISRAKKIVEDLEENYNAFLEEDVEDFDDSTYSY